MKKNVFSPVHIRTKKLSDGRQSIYLDTCIDGQRVKEYLGLYLVPENNRADKAANKATMHLVEDVRARRMVDIQDGKFNINDRGLER